MKKILLFIAIAVAAIACTPQEAPVVPKLVLDTETSVALPGPETFSIIVFESSLPWTAEIVNAPDWCRISQAKGEAGEGYIKFTALENATRTSRQATVVIKSADLTEEITFTQVEKDVLVASETEYDIIGDPAVLNFTLAQNVAYDITFDCDWMSVISSKTVTDDDIAISVEANKTENARKGKITIVAKDNPNLKSVITVKQAVFVPTVTFAPAENTTFPVEGGSVDYTITGNVEFTVTVDADWLTMTSNGDVYTFTAGANANPANRTATVTAVSEELVDPVFVFVEQKGTATTIFSKKLADYEGYALGTPARIGLHDNYVLLSNGTEIHAINAETGEYLTKLALPEGAVPQSMATDDAGTLLVAANAAYNGVFTVYKITSLTDAPTPIITYTNSDIYGATLMGLRVNGDINGNAVITAYANTLGLPIYYVAWEVTNGEVAAPVIGPTNPGRVTPTWGQANGYICPAGPRLADGLFYSAYLGFNGSYPQEYCADPINEKSWITICTSRSTWESAPAAGHAVELNGRKYLACMEYTFFAGCASYIYILDVTDPANAVKVYSLDLNTGALPGGASGDIALKAGDNCLNLYIHDNGQGHVELIEIVLI